MSQEPVIVSSEALRATSERREARQMQRLAERAKTALKGVGLEAEADAVLNPMQAMLALALLEKWDAMRFLDEVSAHALSAVPAVGADGFDNAVRAAWQAAGQTFDTASLLSGLVTSYGAAVKGREA